MKDRKGISSLIAFLIAILIIVLILVPLYFLIIGYSNPQYKVSENNNFPSYQANSEEVTIYFNSRYYKSYSTSFLNISQPNPNYVLSAVYALYNSTFVNVTSVVKTASSSPSSLPSKMIYNFSFPDVYSVNNIQIPLWNSTLILQIEAYNQTTFLTIFPNETAIAS